LFATGLTHGIVDAARRVVANSRIRDSHAVHAVHAAGNAMTHIDPLMADSAANPLVTTLLPVLDRR